MGITNLAIKLAAPLPKLEKFERCLFVGPHPDDLEIGCGATAARFAAEGKEVCFLICLDGRYGSAYAPELTPDELAEVRRNEAIDSAAHLGVKDVRFLDLCDGGFYEQSELIDGIARTVGDFQPDVIFSVDPNPNCECHVDHLNVGEACRRVACFASNPGIMKGHGTVPAPVKALAFYMTAKPNRFVRTKGYVEQQLYCVTKCFPSQVPEGSDDSRLFSLYIRLRSVDFGLRSFKGRAEGFRVLGSVNMHCLPESEKR